eukprot:GHUV01009154.1.p1 GENE.GHUV01009154.1~~GHUV01009154.1.p1  ORF type:complete len:352 (+),score=89.32 GHUV01009154.1:2135-3190(+)
MQRLGGQGPHLLLLHATGFLGAAYEPLAAALAAHYDVYTLDFPGHGSCASQPAKIDASSAAQFIVDSVGAHGLRGCLAFGHSAGGAFGLLASTLSPGLFSAIYCFEAVASTPETHNFMLKSKRSGCLHTAGQLLSSMARRRRRNFSSKQDALQRLRQKPPFAAMHPIAVERFVEFGTREMSETPAAHLQQAQQLQQHGKQQVRGVQLVCDPNTEAQYYEALDPPPAVAGELITCPVMLAVAGNGTGGAYREHTAVQQWILHNPPAAGPLPSSGSSSNSSGQDPLHGILVVLNEELAASIPAEYMAIPGVSHFGPLEEPQLIATDCTAFFQKSLKHQTRQQEKQSTRVHSRL